MTKCAGTGGMFNMLTNIDNTEQGAFQPSELMEVFSGHQHCSLPFLTLTTVHFSSAEPSLDRLHVTVFKPVEFVFSSRNILVSLSYAEVHIQDRRITVILTKIMVRR